MTAGTFRSVVFDCDSTLVSVEGIDLLAGPHREAVQEMTERAMAGEVPLQEVYGRRLDIIRPSRDRIAWLGQRYVETLVPDARETVAALRWLRKEVRIMSGGLRPALQVLGDALTLPASSVWGVDISFDADGRYAGFDCESPLARQGGKREVLADAGLARQVALVGDGATDLEARDEADTFIAYAGVARRPEVTRAADEVVETASIAPVLAIVCDANDRRLLAGSRWAPLLEEADRLHHVQR